MPSLTKELVIGLINAGLSAIASVIVSITDLPLGVVAGMEAEFIGALISGAVIGTMFALRKYPRLLVLIVIVGIALGALVCYSYLLGLGGLTIPQIILSLLLYCYIFSACFFVLTYVERLLWQIIRSTPADEPSK